MLSELSNVDWFILFSFVSGVGFITGWFCDHILGPAGFGAFGNWLLIILGAYAGMYLYNSYGFELHWNPLYTLIVVIGSPLVLLITACVAKRLFFA